MVHTHDSISAHYYRLVKLAYTAFIIISVRWLLYLKISITYFIMYLTSSSALYFRKTVLAISPALPMGNLLRIYCRNEYYWRLLLLPTLLLSNSSTFAAIEAPSCFSLLQTATNSLFPLQVTMDILQQILLEICFLILPSLDEYFSHICNHYRGTISPDIFQHLENNICTWIYDTPLPHSVASCAGMM